MVNGRKDGDVFEPRQALGLAFLLFIGLFVFLGTSGGHPTNLLNDLDGSFGLSLLLVTPLLVPRSVLPTVYILDAIGFFALGIRWLLFAFEGSNNGFPLPIAFFFMAGVFVYASWNAKRYLQEGR